MAHTDEALMISNPRLLSAAYFGLLAIIATIVIDTIVYAIGIEQIIPTFQAIVLDVFIAAVFGALFGKWIIYSAKPYRRKAFMLGFAMVFAAIPLYSLIFLYLFERHHPHVFAHLDWSHMVISYLFILFYGIVFVGLWLAIAAGFAAVYLRGRLIYDMLHSKEEKIKNFPLKESSKDIESQPPKAQNKEPPTF